MANFIVPENPEYIEELRKLETTDPCHADIFNEIIQKLINNDKFLKIMEEKFIEKLKNYHVIRILGTYDSKTRYVGFASLPLPTSGGRAETTLLVSGVGNIASPSCGTYLVQCGTRTKVSMMITELTPPGSSGDITFGFWQTDDRVVFGMKRGPYNYHTNIAMVSEDVNGDGFSKYEIGELYNDTVTPSGWTEAGKRIFLTIGQTAASSSKLATPRTIDGVKFDGTGNITHFGICSTAAATVAKTVSVSNFVLAAGAEVKVLFSNGNTVEKPTLNVNGTGAKQICYKGAALTADTAEYIMENSLINMVYTGSVWHIVGDLAQQQLNDMKKFIHYEEYCWESIPVTENAGQLYASMGPDTIVTVNTGQLKNDVENISCTAVNVPISSDDTGRYRIITYANGARPQPADTKLASIPSVYGVKGSSIMGAFSSTDFIFDKNQSESYGLVKQLLINKWGSDLEIEVYREIHKVW